jgi:hypothetical protein
MTSRKYLSEFGLHMVADYHMLLQQDGLESIEQGQPNDHPGLHIYMIGRRPRVTVAIDHWFFGKDVIQGRFLVQRGVNFESIDFEVPNLEKRTLAKIQSEFPFTLCDIYDDQGKRWLHSKAALMLLHLCPNRQTCLNLEILYVGQSYGIDGSRCAIDRLKSHNTLQAIYAEAQQRSPDQEIWLTLWSFSETLLSAFDGRKETLFDTNPEEDDAHHMAVLDTILNNKMGEQQRINFTEAALIRYFQPEYNKTFKESFPSPTHDTYASCYDIDLNVISVQLDTEELGCQLWSQHVKPKWSHIAQFPLHSQEDRKNMFDIFEDNAYQKAIDKFTH